MTQEPHILLVDDEESIQRAVGPLLRSRGYHVDIASTGAEAITISPEKSALAAHGHDVAAIAARIGEELALPAETSHRAVPRMGSFS